jgi:hypothetical protein
MITGLFDFTLVCTAFFEARTFDVFFIGRDWKKFSPGNGAFLFPVSPKPGRTNPVSDVEEKP